MINSKRQRLRWQPRQAGRIIYFSSLNISPAVKAEIAALYLLWDPAVLIYPDIYNGVVLNIN